MSILLLSGTRSVREEYGFFDQIGGESILLPLIEPADQRRQEHAEGQCVEHGARVYTTRPISGPQTKATVEDEPHRINLEVTQEDDGDGVTQELDVLDTALRPSAGS
jgi:nitrogen-specific signal transduction histidine kinase